VDLLEGDTDVAIRIGPLVDSSLHARALGTHARRVLASPAYLSKHGKPRTVDDLAGHTLLGFAQPENLNHWPLRNALGDRFPVRPSIRASSGETLRQLALAGEGIVCLADFMTARDREDGALVQVMARSTTEARQPVHAVYYGNKGLSARVTCFLDFLQEKSPAR
jgi:DNA-binding transcriptional LysR family regulator